MDTTHLLDTPYRTSLSSRSSTLRAALKDWEKSFAAAHFGRKPGKNDIKAEADIAAKYRDYNKLRDVLAGKLGSEELELQTNVKPLKRRLYDITPQKSRISIRDVHPSQLDPYDTPPSATPKQFFLSAVGPTPQRDGKVLGLFDLLSTSGGSRRSKNTPGTGNRKRNVEALVEADGNIVVQTPSRKRRTVEGDILQHLAGGGGIYESGGKKFSRTPASEGRKFMMSHFFATPNTMRFATLVEEEGEDAGNGRVDKTPLRTKLLGLDKVERREDENAALDTTPNFLKRSHSFKDRLVSASGVQMQSSGKTEFRSPTAVRKGPPTLQRYRSAPKPLSRIVQDMRNMEYEGHDDDMDALRESEGLPLVGNNQDDAHEDVGQQVDGWQDGQQQAAPRIWKKKGQKRTTRRSIMKPAVVRKAKKPKFVAPDESEEEEDELSRAVEAETQQNPLGSASSPYGDFSEDELQALEGVEDHNEQLGNAEDSEAEFRAVEDDFEADAEDPSDRRTKKAIDSADRKMEKEKTKKKKKPAAGTINPNAISHQNFRSLKIRNKNSKAKGAGRGKFGRSKR